MPNTQTAGKTSVTTPSDLEVLVTHTVNAPRQLVYDVHTMPAHLMQWLLGPEGWTMTACEFAPRAGTRYRYAWRKADGSAMEISGLVVEVVPPERIVTTESWGEPWPDILQTLTFTEHAGRTTISTLMRFPSKEARDAALGTGMTSGMAATYERLERYLGTL
jgi:uncharacterized protein YndB with AHSA1/START domain